jgi:hypothetical protein
MSVRKGIAPLLALTMLAFLVACGGSSSPRAVAPPTGGFNNGNLNGTYVFSVSGIDASGFPLAVMGTFTANGSGSITAGTVDMNGGEFSGPAPNLSISSGSTYSVGLDGRGRATLAVSGSPFSSNKLLLDFVLSSSSHGLIIEFDGNGSGSGTIDLQAAGATPTGSYAFILSGATVGSSPTNWATVGNFTLTGATLAGTDDFNESGLIPFPNQSLTGNFALGPSATPSTTLVTSGFGTLTFDVFAIDATHLKFIEMDSTAILSGDAFSQPSTAQPTGTLAFTMNGALGSNPFAAGGFFTTNGTSISGTEDYTDGATVSSQSTPAPFTAAFAPGGTGRFTLGSFATFVGGSSYAAYPSSGGLLLLEIDSSGITTGAAYTQTSPLPTLASSQGYGMNLSGINLGAATGSPVEVDDIAEFTAGGSGTLTAGITDENSIATGPLFDLALSSGTYGTIDSVGRYGLSANAGTSSVSTLNGGFNLTLYTVDGTSFPFIEMDGGQIATGVVVLQNSSAVTPALAHSQMFVSRTLVRPHAARQKKN